MLEALAEAKQRLENTIADCDLRDCEPIAADPGVVSSLLQKSIRRGESKIAQRAALTFLSLKGAAIWRRLMVIAFEDVGVGSTDAVTAVVAASSDAALRKACGGNERVAVFLAGVLAQAPKDRSADHLAGAKDHPDLRGFTETMAKSPGDGTSSALRDGSLDLPKRAIAAILTASRGNGASSNRGATRVLDVYRKLGVPGDLVVATEIAALRTRELITLMVPLIWLAVRKSKEASVRDSEIPPLVMAGDFPLYALDEHTRFGREAIGRFARENHEVRACLERFVPANQMRRAAYVAAFYVDAAPVARRFVWDQADDLEVFGRGRDLMRFDVAKEGITPLVDVMRANLEHLNALRAEVLTKSHPAGASLPASLRFGR
jgi:hypothetical protein